MTSHPHPSLPGLSLHLSDSTLAPLVSTASPSSPEAPPLKLLTTAALSAHTAASRLGLGYPIRILVETRERGPIVLHSFLDPQAQRTAELQRARLHDVHGDVEAGDGDDGTAEEGKDDGVGHDGAAYDEAADDEAAHKHDGAGDESPEDEEATDKQDIEAATPLLSAPPSAEAADVDETRPATADTHTHAVEESRPAEHDLPNGIAKIQLQAPPPPTPVAVEEEDTTPMAPMLVTTVVADSYSRLSDARRAAKRLEGMGRGFQEQWVREQEEGEESEGREEDEEEGEEEGAPEDG